MNGWLTNCSGAHGIDESYQKAVTMLTSKEFAKAQKISISWLAKARKRGDGPPFVRFGRSIRYFPLRKPE